MALPTLVCAAALAGLASPAHARARPEAKIVGPPAGPGISVQGNHLMQNGRPFVARGVQITGLVAPNSQLAGKYIAAHQHFGAAELAHAVADHANLVRFQVSEFGLDPGNAEYDPSYVAEVQQGVELARAEGLDVIVSLQAQAPAGDETRCPLPDAGAATDWLELAHMFGSDPDIMFELYNEPGLSATAAHWSLWKNGGANTGATPCTIVGMQSLVDEIRAAGADNVLILPGLAGEQTLKGKPKVTDPAFPSDEQIAFGIHYPNLTQTSSSWDTEFGNLAGTRPIVVTEWQANGTTNCIPNAPKVAPLLLSYLALRQIGVIGFAFDLPGTIVTDYSYAPTTYDNFTCGSETAGPGQLLFDDFAGEATQASATGAGSPTSWVLNDGELDQLATLDTASTVRALNTPRKFVLGASSTTLDGLGMNAATPAESFTNEATLAASVASGSLPGGSQAVVLELGPTSPRSQQRHPAQTFELAALAAHRNGYLLIAAPEIGLVHTLAPRSRPRDRNILFLKHDLAGAAAKLSDAVVLPFGDAQKQTAGYRDVTAIAVEQANAVHPGVEILDGLKVGGASTATPAALAAATQATSSSVTGYSLVGQSAATNATPLALLEALYGSASAG